LPILKTAGAAITYRRVGTGPAVLLIQGAGVCGNGWQPQVDGLADRYTLLTFDNRGLGGSALDRDGMVTIERMAHDAVAVADAEGIDRFHVVGHSMGGLIAQAVALGARERVGSLALLCTFVRGTEGARMTLPMLATALRMRLGTKRMRRNAFLELVMPPFYLQTCDRVRLARDIGTLFGYDLASQPLFVMRQVRAMAAYDGSARWLELASVPALVVSAAHDRIALPSYGRALAALVSGRYVEVPDAGHGVTIQKAEHINHLLREHFDAADRTGQAAARG
jgi:aminoacrylate hydrolase